MLENSAQPDKYSDIMASLYWTIVTFSSTGFGDMAPVTPLGRFFAVVLITLSSMVLLGIPIGIFAGVFIEEAQKRLKLEGNAKKESGS